MTSLAIQDERPHRVAGATISGWSTSLEIDLDALFSRRPAGTSIAAATGSDAPHGKLKHLSGTGPEPSPNDPPAETVSLSDGTSITFATTDQFQTVNSV